MIITKVADFWYSNFKYAQNIFACVMKYQFFREYSTLLVGDIYKLYVVCTGIITVPVLDGYGKKHMVVW